MADANVGDEVEVWKPVVGHEDRYEISNKGSLRQRGGRELRTYLNHDGYMCVSLFASGKTKTVKVHRMVAMAFIGNPSGDRTIINHKNAIRSDNRTENLEWCTTKENNMHSLVAGRMSSQIGEKNISSKLSWSDVRNIRAMREKHGTKSTEIAKKFWVSKSTIVKILNNSTWKPSTDPMRAALTQAREVKGRMT